MLRILFKYLIGRGLLFCLVIVPLICLAATKYPHRNIQKEIIKKVTAIPVSFIENKGQIDNHEIKFYARTFAGTVFVTEQGRIIYNLSQAAQEKSGRAFNLREEFIGGKATCAEGEKKRKTKVSYFIGNEPSRWSTGLATYEFVNLGEIYPGIEVKLRASNRNIEKLFYVKPGADPSNIAVKLTGVSSVSMEKRGGLKVQTQAGEVIFTKPKAYQIVDGEKIPVPASYLISCTSLTYGFKVGPYDKSKELVIDPLLASTYLGGSGNDFAYAIALDQSGNVYVAGSTTSLDFPTVTGGYNTEHSGSSDGFVCKFDSNLTELLAIAFLGGDSDDDILSMGIDNNGSVFVCGKTMSSNFPVTEGAFDTTFDGNPGTSDCFISKLSNDLGALKASTFLGGSGNEAAKPYPITLALDKTSGDVYVAGQTESSDFPATSQAYDTSFNGEDDTFVARLRNDLGTLKSSTFLGGSGDDEAYVVTVADNGNVYVAGRTKSSDFPATQGAYDTSFSSLTSDCFVSCLDSELKSLVASTALGGYNDDYAYSAELGNDGIYVVGRAGYGFPTTPGAFSTHHNGHLEGFVAKLDLSLEELKYSTFLGGSNDDYARTVAVDNDGNIYIAGRTNSSDFPVTEGAFDPTYNYSSIVSPPDGFIAKLSPDLDSLFESTFFGGYGFDYVRSLTISDSNDLYLTGYTLSSLFPTTGICAFAGWPPPGYNYYNAFVSKFGDNLGRDSIPLAEVLDNTSLPWSTGGDAEWYGTKEFALFDCDAAKSGNLFIDGETWISTSIEGPGILTFYWKKTDQENSLKLYTDGQFTAQLYPSREWNFKAVAVPQGQHELKWIYSMTRYSAYLDKVSYIPGPAIVIESPVYGQVARHRYAVGIRWVSTEGVGGKVRIELFKDGLPIYLIDDEAENDGAYDWLISYPLPPGFGYQIRVVSVDNADIWGVSAPFSISESETSGLGQFLIFQSAEDVVTAMDHHELRIGADVGSSFTVEAWFLVYDWQYGVIEILGKGEDPFEPDYGIWLGSPDSAGFYMSLQNDNFLSILVSPTSIFRDWHHAALVVDGSDVKFFYDGKLKIERECTDLPILVSTGKLRLGVNVIKGGIDEVRISNIARYTENFTPSTIPFTCDEHTLALWHFEEPSSSGKFHDECGEDNVLFRRIPGDIDQDGDVDGEDLAEFALAFGSSIGDTNFNPACDLHEDGVIDEQDLEAFAMSFGH